MKARIPLPNDLKSAVKTEIAAVKAEISQAPTVVEAEGVNE